MIEITLKELDESYQALQSVAASMTGAPLKFRLLPVLRYAKQAIEDLNASLGEIASRHGATVISEGVFTFADIPDEKVRNKAFQNYQRESGLFRKSETIAFSTDKTKYKLSEITKCESAQNPTNANDLAALAWLFTWDVDEAKEEEKAASAGA